MAGGEDEDRRSVNRPVFPYPVPPPMHNSMHHDGRDGRGSYNSNHSQPPPLIERSDPPASMADEPVSLPHGDSDADYSDQMSEVLAKVGEEEVAKVDGDENLSTDPNLPVYKNRKRGRPRKQGLPSKRRNTEGGGRRSRKPAAKMPPRKIKKEPVDEPQLVEQMLEDELADRLPTEQSLAQEEDAEENAIRFTDVGNHHPLLVSGNHLCAVCLSRHSHRQASGVRRTRATSFKRFTSVVCRTCNKFLCVAPRTDGRTCFDIYHSEKEFVRADLPEFNRKDCGDSDVISSEFDHSPDLTEDANMLLQLLQVASGETKKVGDFDNPRKDIVEPTLQTVFPEPSLAHEPEPSSNHDPLNDAPLNTPAPPRDKDDTLETELSESLNADSSLDMKDGQSQAITLLLKVLNQYGNAPVMLRHLLTRWQDKLVLIGQHVNPKPRPPSPKRRRARKSQPKRYEITDPPSSDEDNDLEMDETYEPEIKIKPEKKKPRAPRNIPKKAPASVKASGGVRATGGVKKKRIKNPGGKRGRPKLSPEKLMALKSRYKCTQCDAAFSLPSRLKDHYRVHTGERPYICDKCGKKFMRDMHLKRHRMTHWTVKPFKCATCGKTFISRTSLKVHTYSHTGERPHQCHCCPQRFVKRNTLNEHMRIHTGETPHPCMICNLKFHKKSQLKAHMLYHTGEKPYLCQTCGTRFRFNTAFTEHVRIHTGVKPHVCPHCDTAFRCRSTLKRHVRLHTGEKPYVCTVCEVGFAQRTSLVCHMKKHPGVELPAKYAAKPTPKPTGEEVCIYPVVGRKRRSPQSRNVQQQQGSNNMPNLNHAHSHTSTATMGTMTPPNNHNHNHNHMMSVSGHLEHVRIQEDSMSNEGMVQSQNNHHNNNTSSDHTQLRIPDPGSHFPLSAAWGHDLPTSVAGFQYNQTAAAAAAAHRAQQVTTQPFAGLLPMSTQMPPAFPDQQRFPLDYRFMN